MSALSGQRALFELLLKHSMGALGSRPACLCLSLLVLFAAGYLCNVDAALEHFFSWPYATMDSEEMQRVSVECLTVEDALAIERVLDSEGVTGVAESTVYVQDGSEIAEAKAYGAVDASSESLGRTKFNQAALGVLEMGEGEAVISADLAHALRIKEGDVIGLRQSSSASWADLRISKVVRTFGATAGVLVPISSLEGFRWDDLEVYGSEVPAALDPWIYGEPTVLSKQDACADAKTQAREFLPFAFTNLKQQLAFALCCALSFVLFSLVERELRRGLHAPSRIIGCSACLQAATMGTAFCVVGCALALLGTAASGAALHFQYGISQTSWQYASTFAILYGGVVVGAAGVILLWWQKMRS